MKTEFTALLFGAISLTGCKTAREVRPAADFSRVESAPMTMRGTAMVPGLRAYLDSMTTLPASALPGAVAAHERRMAEMLDAFGADMTSMGMTADSSWASLSDSIKTDLAELPGLSGAAQAARFAGHVGRVRRLLDGHQAMMKGM